MIRHLLKMVWNRKRSNGLIMLEIFLSFVVLFAVVAAATYLTANYRRPLGFSIDRVWSIRVTTGLPWRKFLQEKIDGMKQIDLALRGLPEIESIGGIAMPPYDDSRGTQTAQFGSREARTDVDAATDGAQEVLGISLIAGRWFSKEDDASTWSPAVINQRLANDLYGSENPLGRELPFNKERVIGVMQDFRKGGEFEDPTNYCISRIKEDDTAGWNIPWTIIIKVRPGVTASFEEKLFKTMEGAVKGWTFEVAQLSHERDAKFKKQLAPIIAGGIVAGFLLFMVALGLLGVLWQNVTQRTKEIGLRRALGGSAEEISRQIHGEQFVMTTIGVAAGTILVLQVPILNLITFIPAGVYLSALGISLVAMYALTHLCSLIPGWMAMDIEPAQALHYE